MATSHLPLAEHLASKIECCGAPTPISEQLICYLEVCQELVLRVGILSCSVGCINWW